MHSCVADTTQGFEPKRQIKLLGSATYSKMLAKSLCPIHLIGIISVPTPKAICILRAVTGYFIINRKKQVIPTYSAYVYIPFWTHIQR